MTQYDIFPVYEKVIQKDRVKYMHSNNGTVELYSYVDDKIIQKRS